MGSNIAAAQPAQDILMGGDDSLNVRRILQHRDHSIAINLQTVIVVGVGTAVGDGDGLDLVGLRCPAFNAEPVTIDG